MKKFTLLNIAVLLVASSVGHAATNIVTVTSGIGAGSLHAAMSALNNGDTITFNIAGAGPHYLDSPAGGYPLITAHNVTIDGYSQLGAVPNSNTILSSNNAQIKIVLTATNGNFTSMDYNNSTNTGAGFGPNNFAVIGIYGATNTNIRGLSILGTKTSISGGISSIAVARDSKRPLPSVPFSQSTTPQVTDVHINGCWLGVDPHWTPADLANSFPDSNVRSCNNHVSAFSHRQETFYRITYVCNGVTNQTANNANAMPNRDLANRETDRDVIALWLSTNDFSACGGSPTILATNINLANRVGLSGIIIGVKPGSANPRAEFNVVVGGWIDIIMEGQKFKISGNFLGVLPDGLHDYIPSFGELGTLAESHIEIGRGASDLVIGTDGDGVNDAEERNIFGGVVTGGNGGSFNLGGYQHVIEIYGLSGGVFPERTRNRFAGNYIGVGVDGQSRFTNGVPCFNGSATGNDGTGVRSQVWFGSDLDGVSDALEANVVFNNYPAGIYYPTPYTNSPLSGAGTHGFFDQPDQNAQYLLRRNKLVNNYPFPVNPGNPNGFRTFITNYVNKALLTPTTNLAALYPVISSNSTAANLIGTVPRANATYPYVILDVYIPDPEGLINGLVVPDPNLTNGWVQGLTYLGSFEDNGPLDIDPAPGAFSFNGCSMGITNGTMITITGNYLQDAPGTHNARGLTSLFSAPVTVGAGIAISSITQSGGTVTITWCGGTAPYTLQRRLLITDAWADLQTGIAGNSATDTISGDSAFYRVVGN